MRFLPSSPSVPHARRGASVLALLTAIFLAAGAAATDVDYDAARVGPAAEDQIVVPTNQVLAPAGHQLLFPGRPTAVALRPDGQILAVQSRRELVLVRTSDRTIMQTLPGTQGYAFTGIVWAPDGKSLYCARGEDGIDVIEFGADGVARRSDPIETKPEGATRSSAPGGLALAAGGRSLWVALSARNSVGEIDLAGRRLLRELPAGVAPYTVVLAGEKKAYVSNWGGRRARPGELTADSAGTPVVVDPRTAVAATGTVTVLDLARGEPSGEIEVGLHPCGMALHPGGAHLVVANANSDTLSIIDVAADRVASTILVRPAPGLPFGSAPNAVGFDREGTRLYVACGGVNAVAVLEWNGGAPAIAGWIPAAWYPGDVIVDERAPQLIVANVKGHGSRNQRADRRGLNSHDHLGSVSFVPLPLAAARLEEHTRTVIVNNRLTAQHVELPPPRPGQPPRPVPERHGEPSLFRHVVYIIKENRTYDQVFGDMPQGDGDPTLLMFGRDVTPNHHRIAEQFVLLDNFYCSGVLSADGHQWTDEAYVTDYLEKQFGEFPRSYPYEGSDPIAYSPAGFLWDNALAHGRTFRDYGEFAHFTTDPPGVSFLDLLKDYVNGTDTIRVQATTELHTLRPHLCPDYAGYSPGYPDVLRARAFIRELRRAEAEGVFPNLVMMLLPNDHTSGTRPGRPTPRSQVADNDLALGQIVEALSQSRFWKETCIFVVEDDPQAGLDHVDGHRTVALVISPYTRGRGVDSTNYNQTSMFRTIELILGLPPLHQLDLTASPMRECFQAEPDFTPYAAAPNIIPLDEMNPELSSLSGPALYWAQQSLELDLEEVDRADEGIFNRVLWHSVRGYDVPYPSDRPQ